MPNYTYSPFYDDLSMSFILSIPGGVFILLAFLIIWSFFMNSFI